MRLNWLGIILMTILVGCADAERTHLTPSEVTSQTSLLTRSKSESVLIFNEGPALTDGSSGSWKLHVSSFSPVQAVYVNGEPLSLAGLSYDLVFQLPYQLNEGRQQFHVEVYTTETRTEQTLLLRKQALARGGKG